VVNNCRSEDNKCGGMYIFWLLWVRANVFLGEQAACGNGNLAVGSFIGIDIP
jgi:hypothetical protein